jgi:MerR family mercuric resistance operon transcriptional regulator
MKEMTIGVLARAAGVNIETIRYYQRRGLIGTPRKPPGGVRRYAANTLARLRFIKRAQQLGFSLREIGDLLELGSGACAETRVLAEARLADIETRLHDLQTMRRTLARLIQACRAGREAACPIVESLGGELLPPPTPRPSTRRTLKA